MKPAIAANARVMLPQSIGNMVASFSQQGSTLLRQEAPMNKNPAPLAWFAGFRLKALRRPPNHAQMGVG